jgi:predicted GNAT family acetyltransferase
VSATDDAARFLREAGPLLVADPVRNNVILTLLQIRLAYPEPGRYWTVDAEGVVAGAIFQSPSTYPALLSPMRPAVVSLAVDELAADGVTLPGITADAATAARFAGEWTERTRAGATPSLGQRLYEIKRVVPPNAPSGHVRAATATDRELLVEWFRAFVAEIGDPPVDPGPVVDWRVAKGQVWIWDDGRPVAFAATTDPVEGVVRIGPVYTGPDDRGRGYASALVGELSCRVLERDLRCILYTDLNNPTSNAIYRALGYEAVEEILRYKFS